MFHANKTGNIVNQYKNLRIYNFRAGSYQYNLYSKKKHSITRSTKLPNALIDWCNQNAANIFSSYELSTVNDLGALLSVVKFYKTDELTMEKMVIQQAEKLNLIKECVTELA